LASRWLPKLKGIQIRELSKNSANCAIGGTFEGTSRVARSQRIIKRLTDRIQVAITSRDVPIEKIGANTEFELSLTVTVVQPSSSIEFALSFRTDGDHSSMYGLIELQKSLESSCPASSLCRLQPSQSTGVV
jgi:hypothetical protein